jgi:hypothetical protein
VAGKRANRTCTFTLWEMRGACGTSGRVEWCTHGGWWGDVKKIDCLEDLGADERIILVWMIRDVLDWMNVTVTALCEHRFELCAVYVCSVTVMTTVDLYLQEMNSKC